MALPQHLEPGDLIRLPEWGRAQAAIIYRVGRTAYNTVALPLNEAWGDLALVVDDGQDVFVGPCPGSDRERLPFTVVARPLDLHDMRSTSPIDLR